MQLNHIRVSQLTVLCREFFQVGGGEFFQVDTKDMKKKLMSEIEFFGARLVTGDRESREPCGDQHQGHQDITAGCHFHTQLSPVNTLASLPGQMTE